MSIFFIFAPRKDFFKTKKFNGHRKKQSHFMKKPSLTAQICIERIINMGQHPVMSVTGTSSRAFVWQRAVREILQHSPAFGIKKTCIFAAETC